MGFHPGRCSASSEEVVSKRELKKYLKDLDKNQLSEQIIDLYDRFKDVKTFYDFAFNPKEDKVLNDFKTRVAKEYFPVKGRKKPKARPSIAQKRIALFIKLEMNPAVILDAMLFTIETAQAYAAERNNIRDPFYRSMFNSFKQATEFAQYHGFADDYKDRFSQIISDCESQSWPNRDRFLEVMEIGE